MVFAGKPATGYDPALAAVEEWRPPLEAICTRYGHSQCSLQKVAPYRLLVEVTRAALLVCFFQESPVQINKSKALSKSKPVIMDGPIPLDSSQVL